MTQHWASNAHGQSRLCLHPCKRPRGHALYRRYVSARTAPLSAPEEITGGFTTRYGVKRLVWFEAHDDIAAAIVREKQIKKWRRDWKLNLIERENPDWRDLGIELGIVTRDDDRRGNGFPPSRE